MRLAVERSAQEISVKRMGMQRHIEVQLSVGDSHGNFVVEEELQVDL
jgi:acetyl/propionyl-CoA carboxylase alpha subunit